ncbi:hypothetical protein CYMTET_42396 [Cymbomonas tetramitiformis]|uniref:Ethanolamine-phosphate cytidylyltransferase n=1 Tax=Cymbomonas tetramitiformis TaxID=36881 RepID=A0AAE0F2N7_9CHLO|nr:ethanolamine-phosphate cytidylyltransferase [Cymbomonas tetramitiformis]KAK3248127.1 hypothetical protein CYMTET_42396 [Cymbomonas tetramitiformis]
MVCARAQAGDDSVHTAGNCGLLNENRLYGFLGQWLVSGKEVGCPSVACGPSGRLSRIPSLQTLQVVSLGI